MLYLTQYFYLFYQRQGWLALAALVGPLGWLLPGVTL